MEIKRVQSEKRTNEDPKPFILFLSQTILVFVIALPMIPRDKYIYQ